MKKLRYTVGDWVSYTHEVNVSTRNNVRRALPVQTPMGQPRIGQIVGYRRRKEGTVRRWGGYDYEMPNVFTPTRTIYVWQVATTIRGPVVEVLEEHLTPLPADQIPPGGLPANVSGVTDADRKMLSEAAKEWPRDTRGRWAPEPRWTQEHIDTI